MWKVMAAIGLVVVSLSLAACDDKKSEETSGTTGESTGESSGETGTATTTESGG